MSLEDAGGGATALALQALREQMTSLLASNHQLHARLGRIEAGLLLDGRCGPSLRDDKQRNAGLMTRGGSRDGSLREGRPGGECFGSTLRSEGRQRTGRDQLGCRGRGGLCTHDDETLEQEGVVDERGAVEVDDRVACGGSEKRGAVVAGEGEVGGGPLCEALEVEIPPTILTCPSYHSESGRDSTAPAGKCLPHPPHPPKIVTNIHIETSVAPFSEWVESMTPAFCQHGTQFSGAVLPHPCIGGNLSNYRVGPNSTSTANVMDWRHANWVYFRSRILM
jgi:hypothetical protein